MALPLAGLLGLGASLIDKLIPDKEEQAKAKLQLLELEQKGELTELAGRLNIVQAEASSSNWLTSSWRPITMLTFTGLIVARWFGYSAEGMSEAEILELWEIVKLGLGGYVIGRSVEKTAPGIIAALKNKG